MLSPIGTSLSVGVTVAEMSCAYTANPINHRPRISGRFKPGFVLMDGLDEVKGLFFFRGPKPKIRSLVTLDSFATKL